MEHNPLKTPKENPPLISQSIALSFMEFGKLYSGLALSSIFVSPYFTRLGITSYINSLIWFMPSLVIFITTGLRKKFMYKNRHKSQTRCNLILSLASGISLLGCLIFIFADSISEWYMKGNVATNKSARGYALVLGIIGFVLMQSGLIVSEDCIAEVMEQASQEETHLELWVFRWKGIGRVAGYLLSTMDIFETYTLNLYYVKDI